MIDGMHIVKFDFLGDAVMQHLDMKKTHVYQVWKPEVTTEDIVFFTVRVSIIKEAG